MSRKDGVLALLVVVVWGLNFVVIKVGLHNMPPLMLAGLRFMLVAFPAIFFVARPKVPLNLLLGYGLTISFAQFAFLFCAINFGMPAGLASLVLQAQAFFTIVLGAFTFGERLHGKQLAGIALAIFGVLVLIEDSLNGQHVAMLGFMLTLAAAFSWACGNIFNKKIMSHSTRPAVMSLVIWSALIPIIPFFVASLILDGSASMIHSLVTIDMTTILSLMYLAFVATIVGYGIWGTLLGRYETGTTWGAPYPITWTSINDAFANCGGSGMTLGLLLAIFIASKRAEYRDLAKMSFIPGIFNINEPIMFGLPIVLNPIMMVPFIMVPIVNCAIGYFFVSMEIIPPVAYAVPWTTPGPLIAFLGTGGNWLALLVGFLCLGVATMIYLPFVIAANKVNNMTTNG
ncbi:TPA: O-acetylserine/cysteine exporter [Escherichia coli]